MNTLLESAVKKKRISKTKVGFGTFLGVFLPTFLTMIGVFSYLNLGVLVGTVGFWKMSTVVLFAGIITFLTALSIASTASNTEVKEGGTYFMLSRCFGLEIGASIGIALYVAHTLMIALCILGFSEAFSIFFPTLSKETFSLLILAALSLFAFLSTSIVLRIQLTIFCAVCFSLLTIVLGSFELPSVAVKSIDRMPFWSAFALFYPALTGIEAGAAMSGDLKNPTRSLIIGLLSAVAVGFMIYFGLVFFLAKSVPSEILAEDRNLWAHMSAFPLITLLGFGFASLSSALGCLLSAPRTLQAMAKDRIFSKFLAGRGEKEPRIAIAITVLLAAIAISHAKVALVVPYLTMVLLIIYGMLNLATGIEDIISTPSWRPIFRIHWIPAFVGAFFCIFAMFMIDSGQTFLALTFVIAMYILVRKKGLSSKFDDLRLSIYFSLARKAIYRLATTKITPRNWRPNFIVLSESGSSKSPLLYYTNQMAGELGFLTIASVVRMKEQAEERLLAWEDVVYENLKKQKIEALVEVTTAKDMATGLKSILSNYGIAPLSPNTVVLGECVREEYFESYIETLYAATDSHRNVIIIRGSHGMPVGQIRHMDIWFDDRRKANSDLMLLLAYILRRNPKWSKVDLALKSIVFNEKAKEEKKLYFDDFLKRARMPMKAGVYMVKERENVHEMIVEESRKDAMVYLGLRPPAENEERASYGEYLRRIFQDTEKLPYVTFVICKQKVDLHSILT